MKKLRKLKLVKEELYHLNEKELGNVMGGQYDTGHGNETFRPNCVPTYYCITGNFCLTDDCGNDTGPYGGTLKDCGTGVGYCVTEGCFFETNDFICS